MKSVLILLAIAAVALAKFQYPDEWELWKKVTVTLPDVSMYNKNDIVDDNHSFLLYQYCLGVCMYDIVYTIVSSNFQHR
jgi:hypothetical protein